MCRIRYIEMHGCEEPSGLKESEKRSKSQDNIDKRNDRRAVLPSIRSCPVMNPRTHTLKLCTGSDVK